MATKKTTKKTEKKSDAVPTTRASTTKTFLKSRVATPTLGKWSSGFSACKKYAEEKNVPLIAVWSNGDACGYCVNFEKSIMESAFTKWQASSKCVFWFGCSSDTSKDDKAQGTGFTWARNSKLTTYPFCRVYWKGGKVDTYKSGNDWTGGTAKGGAKFVKKLQDLLKNYKPETATTSTPTPEPPPQTETQCENCESQCSGDCAGLNAEIEKLKSENKSLKEELEMTKGISMSYMAQIQEAETNLAKAKETLSDFVGDLQELVNRMTVKIES